LEGWLVAAIKLFTGPGAPTHLTASAVSESGICAYLDILREVSIGPESAGRVNVIPGLIEHDHVVLEITETAHSLCVSYVFRRHSDGNNDDSKPYLRVGPADIINRAHKARGSVRCDGSIGSCRRRRMGTISSDCAQYPILNLTVGGEAIEVCDTTRGGQYLPVVALRVATAKSFLFLHSLRWRVYQLLCKEGNELGYLVITNIGNNDHELSVIATVKHIVSHPWAKRKFSLISKIHSKHFKNPTVP
jgi:hypothetical protein